MNSWLPQIKLLLGEQLSLDPDCDHTKDPMNLLEAPMGGLAVPMGILGGSAGAQKMPTAAPTKLKEAHSGSNEPQKRSTAT